jgi:hypothetical protein
MFDLVNKEELIKKDRYERQYSVTRVRRLPANKYSKTYMDIINKAKEPHDGDSTVPSEVQS